MNSDKAKCEKNNLQEANVFINTLKSEIDCIKLKHSEEIEYMENDMKTMKSLLQNEKKTRESLELELLLLKEREHNLSNKIFIDDQPNDHNILDDKSVAQDSISYNIKIGELQNDIERYIEENTTLSAMIVKLSDENSTLNNLLTESKYQETKGINEISLLTNQCDNLKLEISEKNNEISQLNRCIQELEAENNLSKAKEMKFNNEIYVSKNNFDKDVIIDIDVCAA